MVHRQLAKVVEPSSKDRGQFLANPYRIGPITRRQFDDSRFDLCVALATRIDLVPAKRVAPRIQTLGAAINDLRFRRM